ncbi:hypothetical protein BE21_37880 [Sorangium cellulosum]|uniref:Uncharacterized protein n=1 Tax=Sorangium cellulosum TaxID=56 RepID=A0A150TMK0_SORCE|nr:hypothetical protein BE21_37880 [Sorangium cellulosum]
MSTHHRPEDPSAGARASSPAPFHPSAVARNRYFYSMLLEAQDMTEEQAFHLGNARRHAAELHGYGTARGLRVDECPEAEAVLLRPGVAIDCLGREVRVERDVRVDLRAAVEEARARRDEQPLQGEPAREARHREERCGPTPVQVYVSLGYQEATERPVQAIGGPETACAATCEPSRVRHGFRVVVSADPPPPGPQRLTDIVQDLLDCEREQLSTWLCDWITCPRGAAPCPCGGAHQCLGLASVRVAPGGRVIAVDNVAIRPLLLPTVLIAGLAQYVAHHVRRSR